MTYCIAGRTKDDRKHVKNSGANVEAGRLLN